MKKIISAALSLVTVLSAASFVYAADADNATIIEPDAYAGISGYDNELSTTRDYRRIGGTSWDLDQSEYTHSTNTGNDAKATVVRFDLSSLEGSDYTYTLTFNDVKQSHGQRPADIKVYIGNADTSETVISDAAAIGDEWETNDISKNIVTWNTRPVVDNFKDYGTITPNNTTGEIYSYDVTQLVDTNDKVATFVIFGCPIKPENQSEDVKGGEVDIGSMSLTATPVEEQPEEPDKGNMTAVKFGGTTPTDMSLSGDSLTITSDGESVSAWKGTFTQDSGASSSVTVTATDNTNKTATATFTGTTVSGNGSDVVFYVLIDRAQSDLTNVTFKIN